MQPARLNNHDITSVCHIVRGVDDQPGHPLLNVNQLALIIMHMMPRLPVGIVTDDEPREFWRHPLRKKGFFFIIETALKHGNLHTIQLALAK
ncbi:hypothetical protein D3C76_1683350 [compost metagenome]